MVFIRGGMLESNMSLIPEDILNCDKDCKLRHSSEITKLVAYMPDMNTTSGQYDCVVCGRIFTYKTQFGNTEFTELYK